MRTILIAALFLLPISAVDAKPLHNVVPSATHHPATAKKLHNAMPAVAMHHPVTGKKLGKKLHNAVKQRRQRSK